MGDEKSLQNLWFFLCVNMIGPSFLISKQCDQKEKMWKFFFQFFDIMWLLLVTPNVTGGGRGLPKMPWIPDFLKTSPIKGVQD